MNPLLIGMNNPLSRHPSDALWPDPPGCTGHRLWEMLRRECGLTPDEYVSTFDRVNLVTGPWNAVGARLAARSLRVEIAGRRAAMLGRGVWTAFRLPIVAPLDGLRHGETTLLYVPHPSGMNRWYNDEANCRSAARAILALREEA